MFNFMCENSISQMLIQNVLQGRIVVPIIEKRHLFGSVFHYFASSELVSAVFSIVFLI